MNWRPWIVAMMLLTAVLVNGTLTVMEDLPEAKAGPEVERIEEVLRHLSYTPSSRRNNFKEMGMKDEVADATAKYVDRFARKQPLFAQLLVDQADDMGRVFCPGTGLPQPYSALEYLVLEENERRDVIDPERLKMFEAQSWFAESSINAVYTKMELTEGRKTEATVMGIAAMLQSKEEDALDGHSPWSTGIIGTWGWTPLKKTFPAVEMKVIQYFSLMHYLTEIANTREGICG